MAHRLTGFEALFNAQKGPFKEKICRSYRTVREQFEENTKFSIPTTS